MRAGMSYQIADTADGLHRRRLVLATSSAWQLEEEVSEQDDSSTASQYQIG
jgi:hypothetical protein